MKYTAQLLLLCSVPFFSTAGDSTSDVLEKNPTTIDFEPKSDSELAFVIPGILPWTEAEFGIQGIGDGSKDFFRWNHTLAPG